MVKSIKIKLPLILKVISKEEAGDILFWNEHDKDEYLLIIIHKDALKLEE